MNTTADTTENFTGLLNIDTPHNSSFLNKNKLDSLILLVKRCKQELQGVKKKRDIIKIVKKYFSYDSVFKTRGVQGITGILDVKGTDEKVVFKVSIDLDRTIEHENIITTELNNLREYCPHIVGNVGMVNLPISNDFINDPEKSDFFNNSNDYFPSNVLLMEYVSPVSFSHICDYLYRDKNLVISQLLQILMCLQVSQVKQKFCHYDLHLDNILIRKVDEQTLFLYRTEEDTVLVPTFGCYPVLIDLGSSYVKGLEGKQMYTNADNYHNGLQPTLYDNLNDMHHLLISLFYYLSDKGYLYDFLQTRFMFLFRHIPVLSRKGWKQLPYDIHSLIIDKIVEDCPDVKKFSVFKTFDDEIIRIMNGLIVLPWLDEGETSFGDCIEDFVSELQKIQDIRHICSNDDVLYILRETVDIIIEHRSKLESELDEIDMEKFISQWKSKVSFIINNSKEIKNIDFTKFVNSAIRVSERMSANYYRYIKEHCNIISEAYLKTGIKSPLDMVHFLLQNATPCYKLTRDYTVTLWDSVNEKSQSYTLDRLTDSQLDILNNTTAKLRGKKMCEFLNIA